MATLNRFLRLLELLEQLSDIADFFTTPQGLVFASALLSYQALLWAGCDGPSAAVLASSTALTLHCGLNRPRF